MSQSTNVGDGPSRQLVVGPVEAEHPAYDLFVGAIGYEARSDFLLNRIGVHSRTVVAAGFETGHLLNYSSNFAAFAHAGEVLPSDSRYTNKLAAVVEDVRKGVIGRSGGSGRPLRVAVDYSSMTRVRIAQTMTALYRRATVPVDVDWLYAPARFSSRLLESGPVQVNNVIPGFEGWADPTLPLHAVVGLGLEGDLVLGVLDDLEPDKTWIFEPYGFAPSYDRRISGNNVAVLGAASASRHFRYDVTQPYTSFLKLSSLVGDLSESGRVVLLPLGPKIFALMCLLLGIGDDRRVAVWRLSAGSGGAPVDRVATGSVLGLRGVRSGDF